MKNLILFLALLISTICAGQSPQKIDSLENLLKQTKGKNLIDVKNDLAWEIKYSDLKQGIQLSKEALEESIKKKYKFGTMRAHINLSACNLLGGNIDSSLYHSNIAIDLAEETQSKYFLAKALNLNAICHRKKNDIAKSLGQQQKALIIFRELNDTLEISGNLHNLAMLNEEIKNYEEAIKLYHEVLDIEESKNNAYGIARTTNELANLLMEINDTTLALKYFQLCYEKSKETNNIRWQATALHGMGTVYDTKDIDSAISCYQKAVELNRRGGYDDYLANNYHNLAGIYSGYLEDYDKGIEYYFMALKIYKTLNLSKNVAETYNSIGNIFFDKKEYDKAMEYINKSILIADSLSIEEIKIRPYFNKFKIYYAKKDYKNALENYIAYRELKDIDNEKLQQEKILEIQSKYEYEKVDKKNKQLLEEKQLDVQQLKRQKIELYGLIIFIVFILFFMIILYSTRKQLNKINKKLTEQNLEIEQQSIELQKSNTTKDKFFSIIAHDLKNPFSGLLGFSDLLLEEVENSSNNNLKLYAENINKAASDTYQLLENLLDWARSQRGSIETKMETVNLKSVVDFTLEMFSANASEKNILLKNSVSKGQVLYADQNILYTIIRNLVNNAVKYTDKNGEIIIQALEKENKIIICIKDTGIGIPKEKLKKLFKNNSASTPGTQKEKGTGLGLILCKEFVSILNGEIWAESKLGEGSTFCFSIPKIAKLK